MIKVTITQCYYESGERVPAPKVVVRVYRHDDLPSLLLAEVDGAGAEQKVERALAVARALGADTEIVPEMYERRLVVEDAAAWASRQARGVRCSGPTVGAGQDGRPLVVSAVLKRVPVEEYWADLLERLRQRLDPTPTPRPPDGTIGTPLRPQC